MSEPRTVIFCDFDGTVASRDVGYNLFHHFSGGKNDALLPDWKSGRLSTRDCMQLECEMVRATPQEIADFLDPFDLDPTFPPFAEQCRVAGIPVIIVSEGLDFYIRNLLARHGLEELEVRSNIGHLEAGGIRIEFPHPNRVCPGCGNCKAARIEEYRRTCGEPCRVVYVGDGYSDACGVGASDVVFAKKDLIQYCESNRISYYCYANFRDVSDRLIQQGLLKPGRVSL